MALVVKVLINHHELHEYHAVRIDVPPKKVNRYRLEDGTIIRHRYDDGADVLARKILSHHIRKSKTA